MSINLHYIFTHKQYLAHVLVLTAASFMYKRMWYFAQIDVKKKTIYNLKLTEIIIKFINKNPNYNLLNIPKLNQKLIFNPFISQKLFFEFCTKNCLSYEEGLLAYLFSRVIFLNKISLLLIPFQGLVYLKTISIIYSIFPIIYLTTYLPYTLIFCLYILILIFICFILQKLFLILNQIVLKSF